MPFVGHVWRLRLDVSVLPCLGGLRSGKRYSVSQASTWHNPPDLICRLTSLPGAHVNALLEAFSMSFSRGMLTLWCWCGGPAVTHGAEQYLSPWGALCCSSRGGTTWPFSAQDFPENSSPCFEACSPLPPPNKTHFLIHDLIPHIIFQPSCTIGSRVYKTLISLPAQCQFLLNFGLLFFFQFRLITSLATYMDTERHITKALEPGEAITRPPRGQFSKASQRGAQITNHCRSVYGLGELSNFEKLAEFISGMCFSRPINI